MRHVRMLVLCLVAMFAMSATTLVVAAPALAGEKCNQECKELKEKEKQEAKEKKEKEKAEAKQQKEREKEEKKKQRIEEKELRKHPEGGAFEKFNSCPATDPELSACIYGEAGPESFFQAGKVTVHFVKPIILRGGMVEEEPSGEEHWIGSRYGNTISKEAEPAPSLTEIDAEDLSESEKARYEAYLAGGGSTKVTATIELAAPATDIDLDETNLLDEESGTAFGFPVEIHLTNKFLGTHCYVGNYQEPIFVPFTTGETSPPPPNTPIHGYVGRLTAEGEARIVKFTGTVLVNNSYAAPGVQGCGISGGDNLAIDTAFGLPSPAGSNTTELVGDLWQTGIEAEEEKIGFKR